MTQTLAYRPELAQSYIGTAIDGPTLNPPTLSVRGRDLNELIDSISFAGALHHLLTGELPTPSQADAVDRYLAGCCRGVPQDHPALDLIARARKAGASWHAAVMAGLAVEPAPGPSETPDLSPENVEGLRILGVLPRYVTLAVRGEDRIPPESDSLDQLFWLCTERRLENALHRRIFDNLMVSFHAGFGVVPPSVLAPRAAAGTGVPTWQALSAGFATCGAMHTGACEAHMATMEKLLAQPDPVRAGRELLESTLAQGKRMFGYGHPFFEADVRVPRLRAIMREAGFSTAYLELYDALQAMVRERLKIEPNLDAMNSTTLLSLGVESRFGSAIFLCSRPAAMVAHIIERRNKPAFGTKSETARKFYDRISLDWL
ncbi:MAG: citrate/2-methylcitrate synthase [Candidatus Eremiobacterota bacterium]